MKCLTFLVSSSFFFIHAVFLELPGDLSYSELHFFSQFKDLQQRGVAQSFAWLTGKSDVKGRRHHQECTVDLSIYSLTSSRYLSW